MPKRAGCRCDYYRLPERFLATCFHIDPSWSLRQAGVSDINKLASASPPCNQHQGSEAGTFADTKGETLIRFFNPRRNQWTEHFDGIYGELIFQTALAELQLRY